MISKLLEVEFHVNSKSGSPTFVLCLVEPKRQYIGPMLINKIFPCFVENCLICEISRGFLISKSQVLILPVAPTMSKMVLGHQERIKFTWKVNHHIWTSSVYLLSVPPVQYWFDHTRLSIENFQFSSSNSESSQKLGLDTIWNNPIEKDHQILPWCPNTILGIAGVTGRIRTWPMLINQTFPCFVMIT